MIFVSSSCIKANFIKESVSVLAEAGFRQIELSGGTEYYSDFENDLLRLQDKHGLNYLVHNYFPPPSESFVLNLASINDHIYKKSIEHCKEAIKLSRRLGSKKFGIHAGFLIDINISEIGKKIKSKNLYEKKESLNKFCEAWNILLNESCGDPKLYIENNVFSEKNKQSFGGINPFLFSNYEGYKELIENIHFTPLVDLAHLKVSARSLGLDFIKQINELLPLTDYIHISDNDGLQDQNRGLIKESDIIYAIEDHNHNIKNKTITIEVYAGIEILKNSFNILNECLT